MSENNQGQLLLRRPPRRNFNPNLNAGQLETTVTRQQLRNALGAQTGQIAEMLGVLDARLEQLGLIPLRQNAGLNRSFMRNVRENLSSIRQQSRATTSLSDLPFRDIPKAIQERIIGGFKRALGAGARSPFTLAAYVGYHGIIMPVPIVIQYAGGKLYVLYCFFFTYILIFGSRHYIIKLLENEAARSVLNFIFKLFWFVLYPTQLMMDGVLDFMNVAIAQSQSNFERVLPALTDGVRGGADMAFQAACSNVPRWAQWGMGCR